MAQQIKRHLLFFLLIGWFVGSCSYDVSVEPQFDKEVGFSTDILAIFNQSCNSAGCHNTGGIKPDLSPANAYQALVSGGYINTSVPDKSELYLWMSGARSVPMPLSGPNSNYNAKVLAWISQGARNN